jgi:hypothetical protein
MSTYKITWLHDLYKKTFRKPKLSNNKVRVNRENITKKTSNGSNKGPPVNNTKAKEGSETIVSGTHLRPIGSISPEHINGSSNAKSIFKSIEFKPYSVIGETGEKYSLSKKKNRNYQIPVYVDIDFSKTALVDAGGLPYFIKNSTNIDPTAQKQSTGPQGAGLSSGALYDFIGIGNANKFPDEVIDKITGIGDATFYQYTNKSNKFNVIHGIGPDFRVSSKDLKNTISKNKDFNEIKQSANIDKQTAISILSLLYKNIFIEFIKNKNTYNLDTLNIVPISVGQFAGKMLDDINKASEITMKSIFNSLNMLNETDITTLNGTTINICLWKDIPISPNVNPHPLSSVYKTKRDQILNGQLKGGYFKYYSLKNKRRTTRKY